MKSYRADAARREMRDILTAVERGEHVEIKRYDTPTAIVVPVDWYEHQRAALAAFSESADPALGLDPPVSAREVRKRVTRLAGLLDGMRKLLPEAAVKQYWPLLNETVGDLAGLLPENAED